MSLLSIVEIEELFANTLTPYDKYSLLNRKNLTQPLSIQLSTKQNTSSQVFPTFLKSTSNFEHFDENNYPHSICFFEIRGYERRG